MGAVEAAVDDAAQFISPFLGKGAGPQEAAQVEGDAAELVKRALFHLQKINAAEQAADPDAPYDASLVGIVYGLLDLITSLGILPNLSPGVAFGQRPRSVLVSTVSSPAAQDEESLSNIIDILVPILEQNGAGVQPLLSQRVLPDIISALAELSFSPRNNGGHVIYTPIYERTISTTPTSRLLPLLTSLLQHNVPGWWKPILSKELALIPLRPHGVRHTVEFLALSHMSKNSQVPQNASGPQTQLPIPLEAITQASRLLTSVPEGTTQDKWFNSLAPQLWTLLDGNEGKELSRAAGQIIAGGILSKKGTGGPKSLGWELFARPLQRAVRPEDTGTVKLKQSPADQVSVGEQELRLSLRRLATIASSYSHAGLMKRLIGPVLLSLWGLIAYALSRPSLDKEWIELPRAIILRYLTISCEPQRIDTVVKNLFWDGDKSWTFGPGSQGGIEIRRRLHKDSDEFVMEDILSQIGNLDERVNTIASLLVEADLEDQVAGAIFLQTTRQWLTPSRGTKASLTYEPDISPVSALTNAKLSEALAVKFKDKFARSPQHIVEFMGQILQDYANEHRARSKKLENAHKPTRANLGSLVQTASDTSMNQSGSESDELASFALSIFNTLIASPDLRHTPETTAVLDVILPTLQYLGQDHADLPIPPFIANAARNTIQIMRPERVLTSTADPQAQYRATLKTALRDLTSPEVPIRTWALSNLRKLIRDPTAFPVIDVPSLAHALLSASIADPESYVHTAAIPVLVDLAVHAPNPTIRILVDAFVDIEERSLRLRKEKEIEEALDFRLRVGEILNNLVLEDSFWKSLTIASVKHTSMRMIVEATLSLASRRGQRNQTLAKRNQAAEAEKRQQEEGEAAWGGPIPNLLDPSAEDPAEQAVRDALFKIVQGWQETGIEEDVRIRASALSILGSIMERRLEQLGQVTVDAALQMVLLILTMETGEAKAILRRAAVLVVMGLLKGMDEMLEEGKESAAGLGMKQMEEVERVTMWCKDRDVDGLVQDHAQSVLEGLETWRMKKLYKIRDKGLRLGPGLGLEGSLRGLNVQPIQERRQAERRGPVIEELE